MSPETASKGRRTRASLTFALLAALTTGSLGITREARADGPTPNSHVFDDANVVDGTLDPQAETERTAQFWETKVDKQGAIVDDDAPTCFEALQAPAKAKDLRAKLDAWKKAGEDRAARAAKKQESEKKLAQARLELTDSKTKGDTAKITIATTGLEIAQREDDDAKSALETAEKARASAHEDLYAIIEQVTARPAAKFEAFLASDKRVTACSRMRTGYLAQKTGVTEGEAEKADKAKYDAEATAQAEQVRAEDLLRKASPLTSALGSGNGFLEMGGAPDRAIFTVMGALGAEQATNGTQVVMTLGLANVFRWSDKDRLAQSDALRNLFLRASLPLSATQPVPVAGSDPVAPARTASPISPTSTPATPVTRMSFVLGTSLEDKSDPRLDIYHDCYKNAAAYAWNGLKEATDEGRASERAANFDVCNRRAAEQQKLALRAGLGLLVEDGTTKVETFGAAFVWAPSSWLYFNGIYQRLFLPTERHSFGGGFSFGANLGGTGTSGVDAWTRIGFDALILGVYSDANKTTETEVRFQVTTKFKLANNILSAGIGPRLLGNGISDPGVLASVALSYDADTLLGPLLQPAPVKP